MANTLYYGDNLDILRAKIADNSVDLIYLDPPFKSNASYNVLFRESSGDASTAQIQAFDDTWHWGVEAESAYEDLITTGPSKLSDMMQALRTCLGMNDMMAYLTMMAPRLLDLYRVLQPTGSLYLHCDPTASHYIKMLLDVIFEPRHFRSEIIWKRTFAHGNVGRNYGDITDTIFWYSKSNNYTWNMQYRQLSPEEIKAKYPHRDSDGRSWQSVTLRNPGVRPNLHYPYTASNGVTYQPHPNGWSCKIERMQKYDQEDRLHFPSQSNGALRLKMYEDESPGERLQNLWADIPPISSKARERLGYPTQKPEALLERIIQASSNEGDVILDPFCGCGTAVAVAERLERRWIGIDITHIAISIMKRRLHNTFGPKLSPYEVIGVPKDLAGAVALAKQDPYQFEWWAIDLVNAQNAQGQKKGADGGIDGYIKFTDDTSGKAKTILVQVKSGEVGRPLIQQLKGVMEEKKAEICVLITLKRPSGPMTRCALEAGFYRPHHTPETRYPRIQILTIESLLDGGARVEYPTSAPTITFRRAKRRAKGAAELQPSLGF